MANRFVEESITLRWAIQDFLSFLRSTERHVFCVDTWSLCNANFRLGLIKRKVGASEIVGVSLIRTPGGSSIWPVQVTIESIITSSLNPNARIGACQEYVFLPEWCLPERCFHPEAQLPSIVQRMLSSSRFGMWSSFTNRLGLGFASWDDLAQPSDLDWDDTVWELSVHVCAKQPTLMPQVSQCLASDAVYRTFDGLSLIHI